jgi:hypothetical protein
VTNPLFLTPYLALADSIKANVTNPVLSDLQVVVPVAVGLFILYKVVSGHTEHAKMLIAEGVAVAGLLDGLLQLARGMSA